MQPSKLILLSLELEPESDEHGCNPVFSLVRETENGGKSAQFQFGGCDSEFRFVLRVAVYRPSCNKRCENNN